MLHLNWVQFKNIFFCKNDLINNNTSFNLRFECLEMNFIYLMGLAIVRSSCFL